MSLICRHISDRIHCSLAQTVEKQSQRVEPTIHQSICLKFHYYFIVDLLSRMLHWWALHQLTNMAITHWVPQLIQCVLPLNSQSISLVKSTNMYQELRVMHLCTNHISMHWSKVSFFANLEKLEIYFEKFFLSLSNQLTFHYTNLTPNH